ncbi:MAG TPA: HAD family phosphatase [Anaerolineales bacterium]|nr:HAD family phosphatase [Anaerolineales bacterium]HNQ94009.1 HAD family phosphatase [Anaerolineales bacterium]HNS59835.1 HAD family phosphatase [Anaerolineales bacterium]
MTHNIKAIIFDFGNVLLEWNPWYVYRRHFENEEAMKEFFHEVDFAGWNAQQDKGRTFKEGVADHSQKFPQYAHLFQAYHDHWKDSIGDAIAGTVEILNRLKQAGYPMYGLSNWSAETFPFAREKYDFFDLFDDMVISAEVRAIKPEPEIYRILLDKIGKPASECLFIDDSLANIEQAKRMGFVTIHFTSPKHLEDELTHMGIF